METTLQARGTAKQDAGSASPEGERECSHISNLSHLGSKLLGWGEIPGPLCTPPITSAARGRCWRAPGRAVWGCRGQGVGMRLHLQSLLLLDLQWGFHSPCCSQKLQQLDPLFPLLTYLAQELLGLSTTAVIGKCQPLHRGLIAYGRAPGFRVGSKGPRLDQVNMQRDPRRERGERRRSRPAPLAGDRKGLSQASHNKLHLNNSAAMRGLIALALPPTPSLVFQLGGGVTNTLEEGSQDRRPPCSLVSWILPGPSATRLPGPGTFGAPLVREPPAGQCCPS